MPDIFDSVGPQNGEFVKFQNVGDAVQGTYIDSYESTDGFGNQQMVYVLKDSNGKIWNVGIKMSTEFVISKMKEANYGYIVGFRFDGTKESKRYPGKTAKLVNPYFDSKFVDHAWLAEQEKIVAQFGGAPKTAGPVNSVQQNRADVEKEWAALDEKPATVATVFTRGQAPDTAKPVEAAVPDTTKQADETLNAIRTLAVTKGLVPAGIGTDVADSLIEAFTGFKLNEKDSYTKIIVKLSGYTK